MAIIDVKEYYKKMAAQYTEMKQDLEEFSKGLEDGYITEDQLEAAKEETFNLESNFQRLAYIIFLLEMPKRKSKKKKFMKANKDLVDYFEEVDADYDSIVAENESALTEFRRALKELKKTDKKAGE